MRLFLYELKKIWTWKIVLAVGVVSIGLYYLFFGAAFSLVYLGEYGGEDIAVEWADRYGLTLEEEEVALERERLEELKAEFGAMLALDPVMVAGGITSYDALESVKDRESDQTFAELDGETYENPLTPEEKTALEYYYEHSLHNDIWWDIVEYDQQLTLYSDLWRDIKEYDQELTLHYDSRFEVLEESLLRYEDQGNVLFAERTQQLLQHELTGLLHHGATSAFNDYASFSSIILVVSLLILLAPTVTRDNKNNMRQIQWSSKAGRKIALTQFVALFSSGITLFALQTALLALAYPVKYDWSEFSMNGFYNDIPSFFDMTFGEYMWAVVGLIALFAVAMILGAFLISHVSKSNLSLVFKVAPMGLGAIFVTFLTVMWAFTFGNFPVSYIMNIAGGEIIIAGGLTVLLAVVVVLVLIRQKKREWK